jgi:hypothetical protein
MSDFFEFTVYDPTTGQIFFSGVGTAETAAPDGKAILLDVRADFATQKIDVTQTPPVPVAK